MTRTRSRPTYARHSSSTTLRPDRLDRLEQSYFRRAQKQCSCRRPASPPRLSGRSQPRHRRHHGARRAPDAGDAAPRAHERRCRPVRLERRLARADVRGRSDALGARPAALSSSPASIARCRISTTPSTSPGPARTTRRPTSRTSPSSGARPRSRGRTDGRRTPPPRRDTARPVRATDAHHPRRSEGDERPLRARRAVRDRARRSRHARARHDRHRARRRAALV